MSAHKGIVAALDNNGEPVITVDLDVLDIDKAQGFASGVHLARVDFLRAGKRVTAHLDAYTRQTGAEPTVRLTVVNRTRDTSVTAQARPWCRDDERAGFGRDA